MPAFAQHRPTKRHGWITGTAFPLRSDGVYKVLFRTYPYDDNHPWWDQPHFAKGDCQLVRLDDCDLVSTDQALLLGILIPKPRLTVAPEAP